MNDTYSYGGSMKSPTKRDMLNYLRMYFDYYDELQTIAVEDNNILTEGMILSLDDEELEMAYYDAVDAIRSETQFAKGGGVVIRNGREYPTGSAWTIEHNKRNKAQDWERYSHGGIVDNIKEDIKSINVRLKALEEKNTEEAYRQSEILRKQKASLEALLLHYADELELEKRSVGARYYADGGKVETKSEVQRYFENLNYSVLPPKFAEYVKKEILTDPNLMYLSPKEPIFLEIKDKIESYGAMPTTISSEPSEKERIEKEIADLEGLRDFVEGAELTKIIKEIEDLQGLLLVI